jgi:hypothetical protein
MMMMMMMMMIHNEPQNVHVIRILQHRYQYYQLLIVPYKHVKDRVKLSP